jgi:2-polyprenyl-3-methyl-5-hydroxy-6-metoxy-1,4-benzoquinol methylase
MPKRAQREQPDREYYLRFDGDLDEKAYNSTVYVQKFWQRTKIDEILRFIGSGELVLDVGSGSGIISRLISEKNFSVPLDISQKCIKNCRKLGLEGGVVADARQLPFMDKAFDRIACVELIEHLGEPGKCVSEFHRTLKDGGTLILTTPNYMSLWPLVEWLWDMSGKGRDYRKQHVYRFDPHSMAKLLEENDFIIESKRTIFLLSPFSALFSERLTGLVAKLENIVLERIDAGMLITVKCRKK